MPASTVICIGNVARGDDGVAHRVADLIEERLPEGASLLRATQLDVAMADDLGECDLLVVVDARRRTSPAVEVTTVEAAPHGEYGHALSPAHLLDIAWALYSVRVRALIVSVAAPEMEHADTLSETAEAASIEAASEVLRQLES